MHNMSNHWMVLPLWQRWHARYEQVVILINYIEFTCKLHETLKSNKKKIKSASFLLNGLEHGISVFMAEDGVIISCDLTPICYQILVNKYSFKKYQCFVVVYRSIVWPVIWLLHLLIQIILVSLSVTTVFMWFWPSVGASNHFSPPKKI